MAVIVRLLPSIPDVVGSNPSVEFFFHYFYLPIIFIFLARLHEVHRAIVVTSVVRVYVYVRVRVRVTLSVKVFKIVIS